MDGFLLSIKVRKSYLTFKLRKEKEWKVDEDDEQNVKKGISSHSLSISLSIKILYTTLL